MASFLKDSHLQVLPAAGAGLFSCLLLRSGGGALEVGQGSEWGRKLGPIFNLFIYSYIHSFNKDSAPTMSQALGIHTSVTQTDKVHVLLKLTLKGAEQ